MKPITDSEFNRMQCIDERNRLINKQIIALYELWERIGWPEYYTTDLTEHDVNLLRTYAPKQFIWVARECGTNMFILDVPHNNILDPLEWYTANTLQHGLENPESRLVYLFINDTPIHITAKKGAELIRKSTTRLAWKAPLEPGMTVIYSKNGFILGKWEKGKLMSQWNNGWIIQKENGIDYLTILKSDGKVYPFIEHNLETIA